VQEQAHGLAEDVPAPPINTAQTIAPSRFTTAKRDGEYPGHEAEKDRSGDAQPVHEADRKIGQLLVRSTVFRHGPARTWMLGNAREFVRDIARE